MKKLDLRPRFPKFLATTLTLIVVGVQMLPAISVVAQESGQAPSRSSPEAAAVSVAEHLSPPYALYLYESLTRQILSNERVMEKLDSPQSPMAKDSLWALGIISDSLLLEGQDGQYLDVRHVPPFFSDIAHRYLNASHYWPDQEITQDTRREHLAAWYSVYLMLLVANASQDEIARTLRGGMFDRSPEGLKDDELSLVERLRRDGVLSDQSFQLVQIQRSGPSGIERLAFPTYLDRWKAKIASAYGSSNFAPE